jgi:hypothetical protein
VKSKSIASTVPPQLLNYFYIIRRGMSNMHGGFYDAVIAFVLSKNFLVFSYRAAVRELIPQLELVDGVSRFLFFFVMLQCI